MASGKAIVAADTPTVREVLKGAGLLVKPRDPVSLAEAIRKLIKDPDLRTLLGNRARAIALAEYDWQRILPLFDQIYDEVHAETRRSKTE
jgi:colanic acid biosynthesis glycosyl transferase WcaI